MAIDLYHPILSQSPSPCRIPACYAFISHAILPTSIWERCAYSCSILKNFFSCFIIVDWRFPDQVEGTNGRKLPMFLWESPSMSHTQNPDSSNTVSTRSLLQDWWVYHCASSFHKQEALGREVSFPKVYKESTTLTKAVSVNQVLSCLMWTEYKNMVLLCTAQLFFCC